MHELYRKFDTLFGRFVLATALMTAVLAWALGDLNLSITAAALFGLMGIGELVRKGFWAFGKRVVEAEPRFADPKSVDSDNLAKRAEVKAKLDRMKRGGGA